MIPYGKQSIGKSEIAAVARALRSSHLTQGPAVREFEKNLAAYAGVRYAAAVSNGTAALHLAYLVLGLKKGDEIITTPNTFVATSNMALACGARAVFCDIRPDTYNIDESKIERLITRKTRAIVPVHFAGQPCDMEEIWRIARKHNLAVIEDASHALGASYRGRLLGGGKSDMVIFSFHPVKSITTGEGGAILTNSRKYYETILRLRTGGTVKSKEGFVVMTDLGFNYRLTDIQSALGSAQLRRLEKFVSGRRRVAALYKRLLKDISDITLPRELAGNHSSWHLFVILLKSPARRAHFRKYLAARGIGTQLHYFPVPDHPYYKSAGYGKAKVPAARRYAKAALSIPIFPDLKLKEVGFIASSIKEYFA